MVKEAFKDDRKVMGKDCQAWGLDAFLVADKVYEKEQMDKLEKENDKRIKAGKPPKKPKEKKKEYPPDGYTRPLYVRKGEWVMRLRKRVGYMSTFFLIPS